jgi:hypothetical protein
MVAADELLLTEMAKHRMRELVRKTGPSHHTIGVIKAGKTVRQQTLAIVGRALGA